MNGVDYTQSLNRARQSYNDKVERLSDDHNKEVERLNKTHKHITDQQQDRRIEDKNNLEQSHQAELEKVKERTRKFVEQKNNQVSQALKQEREMFGKSKEEDLSQFRNRIDNVSKSYQKSFDEERLLEKQKTDNLVKNSEEKLKFQNLKNEDQHFEKDKTLKDKTENFRQSMLEDRRKLVEGQVQKERSLQRDSTEKLLSTQDRMRGELENTKLANNLEKRDNERTVAQQMTTREKLNQDKIEKLAKNFEETSTNFRDRARYEQQQTNKQNSDQIRLIQKQREEDVSSLKSKLGEVQEKNIGGQGGLDKFETENLKKINQNKEENYKQTIIDLRNHAQNREVTNNDKFNKSFLEEKQLTSKQQELKEKISSKQLEDTTNKLRTENSNTYELFNKEHKRLESQSLEQLESEKMNRIEKLNAQKREQAKLMSKMNDLSHEQLNKMQQESAREKSGLIELSRRNESELRERLVTEFNDKIAKKDEQIKMQLEHMYETSKKNEETLSRKIESLTSRLVDEKSKFDSLVYEMEKTHQQELKKSIATNTHSYLDKMEIMRKDFEGKLKNANFISERKASKIADDYNAQMGQMEKEFTAAINRQKNEFKNEYEQLLRKSNMEKETLISQYEARIEKMQMAESMKDDIKSRRA